MQIRNKYKRIANRAALIFGLISLTMIFLPSLANIDGMDGGFALIFVGFFMLIVGIITVVIYGRMGKMFASMSRFESVLAQWHIGNQEYARFAAYDVKENTAGLRATRWLIISITAVVCIILAIAGMETGFVIVFGLSLMVFIYLVSLIAISSQKRKLLAREADIILAHDGGIINGTLHPWSKLSNRLEGTAIVEIEPGLYVMEIAYSTPNRGGRVDVAARFPIPEGKLTEAQYILEEICKNQ